MALDKEWRQERFKLDNANKEFKVASKAVGEKKKAKQDAEVGRRHGRKRSSCRRR